MITPSFCTNVVVQWFIAKDTPNDTTRREKPFTMIEMWDAITHWFMYSSPESTNNLAAATSEAACCYRNTHKSRQKQHSKPHFPNCDTVVLTYRKTHKRTKSNQQWWGWWQMATHPRAHVLIASLQWQSEAAVSPTQHKSQQEKQSTLLCHREANQQQQMRCDHNTK